MYSDEDIVYSCYRFDDVVYSSSAPVELGTAAGEGVYSVIDEVLLNNRLGADVSSLEGAAREKMGSHVDMAAMSTPPLPKPRVKKTPLSKQDSGLYARLDETKASSNLDIPMEVIKDTPSDCRRPPTPPPRRHRNISTVTKGSDYDEAMGSGQRLNIPGVRAIIV